jgi:hypothetical protein
MAAFDPATRLGSTLRGKWTLERLLGTGGMAAVYVGAHKIGRRDAIKLLHPEVAAIRDLRERFEQEAHAVNRFRHAGAVEVRDIDVADDGAPFLVMELLEGESLLERVRGRGVTTPELLRWVDELLDVLAAAHASGIVHRDIKPDNLFLARDPAAPSGERLKVLDFGIARLREGARSRTALGARLGTVAYMPPEQVRGGAVDHRVDLFATGATMFRLLARRRIHEASTEGELLGLMATTPAPPLRSVAPEIPERIALVVDRALAFDARDRYPDATSMQLDVRAVREGRDPPFATEQRAAGLGGARQGEPTVRRSERPLAEAPTEAPAERRAPSAGARSTSVTVPAVTLDAPTLRRDDAADEATTQERAPRPLGVEPEPFPSTKAPGQGAERQGLAPLAESVAVLAQQAARPASGAAPAAEDGGHQPLGHQPLENQPFGHQPLGHQPLGHQPLGHQPSGHQPSGRQTVGAPAVGAPTLHAPDHCGSRGAGAHAALCARSACRGAHERPGGGHRHRGGALAEPGSSERRASQRAVAASQRRVARASPCQRGALAGGRGGGRGRASPRRRSLGGGPARRGWRGGARRGGGARDVPRHGRRRRRLHATRGARLPPSRGRRAAPRHRARSPAPPRRPARTERAPERARSRDEHAGARAAHAERAPEHQPRGPRVEPRAEAHRRAPADAQPREAEPRPHGHRRSTHHAPDDHANAEQGAPRQLGRRPRQGARKRQGQVARGRALAAPREVDTLVHRGARW